MNTQSISVPDFFRFYLFQACHRCRIHIGVYQVFTRHSPDKAIIKCTASVMGTPWWRNDGLITGHHQVPGLLWLTHEVHDPVFRRQGLGATLTYTAFEGCRMAGRRIVYCFSTGAGSYWQRFGFREVSVREVIDALPDSPQVNHFDRIGWLPTEIAWRRDL